MTKIIIPLLAGIALCCSQLPVPAQSSKEYNHKEFSLLKDASNTTLFVYNVEGSIKVEGYSGNTIVIDMEKTVTASDSQNLAKGNKEFRIDFSQNADSIIAFIAEPFDSRPHKNHYHSDYNDKHYQFRVDFTVKVPFDMNLQVSTINNGVITIANVNGALIVNNINAGITITNAKGSSDVRTINGDIEINYADNPLKPSTYYDLNGNIRVTYLSDLSADIQFKTMNGEFFTDFPNAILLPATSSKIKDYHDGETVYRIDKTTAVRFGSGGHLYKFETLNGNVYIKKQL